MYVSEMDGWTVIRSLPHHKQPNPGAAHTANEGYCPLIPIKRGAG